MAGKITAILAKKEAETYCSHGLHKEALDIYKKSPKVYLEWKQKSLGGKAALKMGFNYSAYAGTPS